MKGGMLRAGLLILLVAALEAAPPVRAQEPISPASPADSTQPAKSTRRNRAAKSAPPSPAKRKAPAPKAGRGRRLGPFTVTGSFEFQAIYDDNIFRYSPTNIDRFRRGDYKPGEFDLDTYDDLILSPRLNLNFAFPLLGRQVSSLRFSYTRWQYLSNPDKSNEAWAARWRQPTIGNDFAEFGYTFAPLSLIRPLGDRAPFTEPYSSAAYSYYPFKMVRNTFLMAYQRRMSDRLTVRAEGGRVLRFYNQRFIENDNWEWNGALNTTFAFTPVWRVSGRYAYGHVKARALDSVGETRENSDDGDPSYKRDLYQLTLGFAPKRMIWRFNLWELTGQYQAYYYTSEQPYWVDPTHVGRKDEVFVVESTLGTGRIWGPMTGEIGYRFTKRQSSSGAAADLEEDKNYHNQRFWVGTSYPF
jgi:hypothetical protein